MAYDFDSVVPRRGTDSYKWDSSDDPDSLPMWVADMDFRTAPPIVAALERRVRHGIFGYEKVPQRYFDSVIGWFSRRHGFPIEREWMLYTSGVVPAISAILRAITQPNDGVIVQTPVYNCFFSSVRNLQCQMLENRLLNRNNRYEIDFEDLEAKAADSSARVLLLCNPHNPVGRSWTEVELRRIGEICFRHQVTVVSDEIHCDLVFPDNQHRAFAALGPEFIQGSITCLSPSKSFNMAGLQIANIIVKDPVLRARVDKALNVHEVCDVNPFGVEATIAAYSEGEGWLDELRQYLLINYNLLKDFIDVELPWLKVTRQEATYLAWIDCRSLGLSSSILTEKLASTVGLLINEGTLYGQAGEGFVRLNMACPRSVLLEGLGRLKRFVLQWSESERALSIAGK